MISLYDIYDIIFMNQLILRQIPNDLNTLLRKTARREGSSLNKLAIRLLKKAVGLQDSSRKKRDFSKLSGTWSQEEADEFIENTKAFEKIDSEIWK